MAGDGGCEVRCSGRRWARASRGPALPVGPGLLLLGEWTVSTADDEALGVAFRSFAVLVCEVEQP